MAITNQDRVGKALEPLGIGLGPFVERELTSTYRDGASAEASRSDPAEGDCALALHDVQHEGRRVSDVGDQPAVERDADGVRGEQVGDGELHDRLASLCGEHGGRLGGTVRRAPGVGTVQPGAAGL